MVISARGQENDKVAALDAGADDYVTKPFSVGELMARVRVALRHASRGTEVGAARQYEAIASGRTLRVDLTARHVRIADSTGDRAVRRNSAL